MVIVVIIVAAVGHAAHNLKKNLDTTGNAAGVAPAASYKVGDTATTAGWRVTVFGFKDPQRPQSQFSEAPVGFHFVSVDVQVTNPSSSQHSFSSVVGLHLVDAENRQYDEELPGLIVSPGPPDGEIAAGQSARGFVVFKVPDGTTGLRLRVQGELTAAGAVFALS